MSDSFESHIREQVKCFLQTVLVIDDEAYRPLDSSALDVDDGEDWGVGGRESLPGKLPQLKVPLEEHASEAFDAKSVSVAFAKVGLSCAILSPQSTQENKEHEPAFTSAAKRADVLVLDWSMNGDHGQTAKDLVGSVLRDDASNEHHRLRLIVVYTGEPFLGDIAVQIALVVKSILGDEPDWDDRETMVSFCCGPVRVSVYAKEHVSNLPIGLEERRRSLSALPQVTVEEFGRHRIGLVTTAAISALAAIRNDAHRLLAVFGPELDPAVLGQRVALPHPEDVERQVEELIGSELLAIVQDHEVGAHIGVPEIEAWLAHDKSLGSHGCSEFEGVTDAIRLQLLKDGLTEKLKGEAGISGNKSNRFRKRGAALFASSEEKSDSSRDLLGVLMSMRSRYTRPIPRLQLGSVVEQGGVYAVCVQPLCDCVRIVGERAFPLLPAEVVEEDNGGAGGYLATVYDPAADRTSCRNGYVRLRVRADPWRIQMVAFAASTTGEVESIIEDGAITFRSKTGEVWRWIGELNPEHAQRVVVSLAASLARVGVTEVEALRVG
ncbi:MAG: hypothetical protein LBI33_00430 [Propionibacteriaceae bacterium]|jgi:hypothetical protein|nr:hypothetical protein [Propionibacteriaceae bacterium]